MALIVPRGAAVTQLQTPADVRYAMAASP